MGMRIEWVRYGRPAAEALHHAISAAKGGEPLTPVTVVVPSNHVGVAARRLLGSGALGPLCGVGTGLAAVSFLTAYRMAELLGSSSLAGRDRRPVSTPVLAAALRQVLADAPGVFAPVAQHPATELALVNAYKELRDVSAQSLDRLAGQGARAADVVRLYRAARDQLASSWYDEEDLINGTVETLDERSVRRSAMGAIVVYLPQRLSRHAARLLDAVAQYADVRVLAGTTGDSGADADVERSMRRLQSLATPPQLPVGLDPMDVASESRTRIVTTSDGDEEVRTAVRAVVDAVLEGTALDRIAILYASPDPYARLVHEQLAVAGIDHNGTSVMPLTARLAGRTLLGLLGLPRGGFRREDVFAWLAGARIHHEGRATPVTAWERISRDAGVVAGTDWDRRLATYAGDCDADAERAEADPDTPEWRAQKLRADAEQARALRSFVLRLMGDLAEQGATSRSWTQRAQWARRHLHDLLGSEHRRMSWPLHEQRAAEGVERALDRLAGLDTVEHTVTLEVFARTLELELDADLGRVGRMGEGVLVGSIRMGVGLDLDLVVVLGLTEGSFPSPAREDSLLPDHERVVADGELPLLSEGVDRQHQELLATLAGAERQLLCAARGDLRRSTERIPSRWVLDIASALAGKRLWSEDLPAADNSWIEHVASFDAGLRRVEFPATDQEYRLRALLASQTVGSRGTVPPGLEDPVLGAGVEMLAGRRSRHFTRFDGNLAGLQIPSPADKTTSATRLEGWAVCPFAYLLKSVLQVDEVENPEDRLRISALDQGTLVHDVLEKFIDAVLDRNPSEQPEPTQPWSPSDEALIVSIAEAVCDRYEAHGLTGRPIFWQRDKRRIIADLRRFLVEDNRHRSRQSTRPVAAELAFGMPRATLDAVEVALPDGRSVRFRGKADRMDLAADGTAHIVDYKTGSARRYKGLSEDNPDARGTKLQLPVYGLAARQHQRAPDIPVMAHYWFVSRAGDFSWIGYQVTDSVLDRMTEVVGQVVAGIEGGVFPNFPTATSTTPWVECAYCDPDGLGTVELARRMERKKSDGALTRFMALAGSVETVGDTESGGAGDE
ncbi:MAG: PD-(D/E)XK nuclease family protein [Acidimicrobiales bacterium]